METFALVTYLPAESLTVPAIVAPACARSGFGIRKEKIAIPATDAIFAVFRFIDSPSFSI
jgi:hypothetical protein